MTAHRSDEQRVAAMRRARDAARHQRDFTAAKAAAAAGVSVAWLYQRFGGEFRALRAELPGPLAGERALVTTLRAELRRQAARIRDLEAELARRPSGEEVEELLRLNEAFDHANRSLRADNERLQREVEATGHYVELPPPARSTEGVIDLAARRKEPR